MELTISIDSEKGLLDTSEADRALRMATSRLGAIARREMRRSLRDSGVRREKVSARIKGQRGRAWVGGNTIPAKYIKGAITPAGKGYAVNGVYDSRLFLWRDKGMVLRKDADGKIRTPTVPMAGIASSAQERAIKETDRVSDVEADAAIEKVLAS